MAGIDFIRKVASGELSPPPFAVLLGMDIAEVEDGRVVFTATPDERHYNPIGVVHAGLAATLLDSTLGCAVHTKLPAGSGYTTLETKFNLDRMITKDTGPLRCEGTVVTVGSRVGAAEGRVTGQDGRVYAHGTSTCLILS
jgi:uncharacterized protein (TIGR00369 family)